MNRQNARDVFSGSEDVQVRSSSPGWICLDMVPDLAIKDRVVGFLRTQMETDLAPELCEQLAIAMDELLANAIEHGCKSLPQCGVELTYIKTSKAILFHTRDAGPGFSIKQVLHSAINNPPEDPLRHARFRLRKGLRPGGFGIMLVRQIADELIYNENGNEAILIKYL